MSLDAPAPHLNTVTCSLPMMSVSTEVDDVITAVFSYRTSDPYSVHAAFSLPGEPIVHWVMARDLLREGVALPSGLGDVRIYPGDQGLLMELRSDHGRAFLYGPIEPVIDFVDRVYQLVPEGVESTYFRIDDQLAEFDEFLRDSHQRSSTKRSEHPADRAADRSSDAA